ncbi:MAG: AAA family ATPase [Halobacteriales archaeon]|nr:AAA family ATPase [Halobacteriales archaeon]
MRRHQGLYLASAAGWLSSALRKFKNAYWSAVKSLSHLVPYGYGNSLLHFLPYFVGGVLFAVLLYAFGVVALAFVLLIFPPEMLGEVLTGLVEVVFVGVEPFAVEPFYVVVVFLAGYLVFVLRNRGWWNGLYESPGTERWRLFALCTLIGGASGVYLVLLRRGILETGEFATAVGYVFFGVGVVGFTHYFGGTLLDDTANHGAEMDDLWRAVVYFEGQSLVVVSAYAVFFGLPFSSGVSDALVLSPFVFGLLYVGYRYVTLGGGKETAEETVVDTEGERAVRNETAESDTFDKQESSTGDTDDMNDPTENLDRIQELLDSGETAEKRRGMKALYAVARQNPEDASRFVPVLVGLLDDDHTRIRGESAEILWEIAKEKPEKTAKAVEGLGELMKDDYPPAQRVALGALGEVAKERPHDVSHLVDEVVLLTESPNRRIQEEAFRFLKNVGMDGDGIREKREDLRGGVPDATESINEDVKRRERQAGADGSDTKFLEPPPDLNFEDVGGMRDLLDELNRRVVRPLRDPEVYEEHGASVVNGVLFHGPPGTGKTYIAKALAGELGYSFVQVHSSDVLSKYIGESANLVEEIFDTAIENQPCVVFFDEIDAIASDRTGGTDQHQSQRQMVSELLRQLTRVQGERVVVMGATNILEEVDDAVKRRNRFDMLFEVPLPDAKAREEIFKVHLRDSPHDDEAIDWDALVEATEGYAAGDIETIVNHSAMKAAEEAHQDGDEVVPISQRHLEAGVEDVEPSSKDLSGAVDHLREPPDLTFDDVGGMEDLKQELRELVIEPLENPEMYEQYGLTTANGVLAHGPPGTGKTYTAEALAGELGYRFISVKPDDIVSKWAGEAPNKMNEVFDVAIQNQPCLVLMDELDAIASERGSATETRTERQTVNQLLTELERIDGEDVIVLATTNAYDDLDPAVVRTGRFDRKIEFPPPDAEARVEILKIHLREPPLADDIDWDELARETDGLVASDLAAVAEGSARKAIEDSRTEDSEGIVPVGQEHIEEAVEEVEPTLLKWRGSNVA